VRSVGKSEGTRVFNVGVVWMLSNDGRLEIEDILVKWVVRFAYPGTKDVYYIQKLVYHDH
jgi:hypothetical protein